MYYNKPKAKHPKSEWFSVLEGDCARFERKLRGVEKRFEYLH